MSQCVHHELPESWGDKASDYEALFVPFSAEVARRAVALAGIGEGQRYIDVAAGTGAMSLAAHAAGATVIATDFSEGMLDVLRAKLERVAITNVEVRRMDSQALDLPDAGFDAAGCGFGLQFFPDQAKALAELHRVLRPGGCAVITTTGHPGSSQLQTYIGRSIAAAIGAQPGAPMGTQQPPAGPVSAPSVEALADSLSAAGFRRVRVETIVVPWPIPDPTEFWEKWAIESPPTAAAMRNIPPPIRGAAGHEFARLLRDSGLKEFDVQAYVALGQA